MPRTARLHSLLRTQGSAKKEANTLNAALAPKASPSRAGAHFTSFFGSMRRPRAASLSRRRYFSINFFPRARSQRPDPLVARAAPDIDRVLVYTGGLSLAIRRADTEAKWPRINQRRPIINELRPRPPRVCIKTRLFVTHLLERDRLRPAFVITLRRQTVSIRRWTRHGGGDRAKVRRESVPPFLRASMRRGFALGARSPLFFRGRSARFFHPLLRLAIRSARVFLPCILAVSFETTPTRREAEGA